MQFNQGKEANKLAVLDSVDNPACIEVAARFITVAFGWASASSNFRLAHCARLQDVPLLARRRGQRVEIGDFAEIRVAPEQGLVVAPDRSIKGPVC